MDHKYNQGWTETYIVSWLPSTHSASYYADIPLFTFVELGLFLDICSVLLCSIFPL